MQTFINVISYSILYNTKNVCLFDYDLFCHPSFQNVIIDTYKTAS